MKSLEDMMGYGKWIIAAAGAFVNSIPELTWFLLILMVIDAFFALLVTIKKRERIDPNRMWTRATHQMGSLGIICMAAVFNSYVDVAGIDWVQVATLAYIPNNLVSIFGRATTLGVPVPDQFARVLELFKEKQVTK